MVSFTLRTIYRWLLRSACHAGNYLHEVARKKLRLIFYTLDLNRCTVAMRLEREGRMGGGPNSSPEGCSVPGEPGQVVLPSQCLDGALHLRLLVN